MINQAIIVGRVGKIDTKALSNGNKVTNISMVTSKKIMKDGQREEKVTWHNATLFGKLAETAEKYVKIGDILCVIGEMENQKYQAKDGTEKTKHYILVNEIKFLPNAKAAKPESKPQVNYDDFDDAVPF